MREIRPRRPRSAPGSLPTRSILAAAALLALAACGDGTEPLVPTEIRISAGDNQSAVVGSTLPAPLQVTVVAANDRPVPDVSVTWQVTVGIATVNPASTTTNADGIASATVALGTTSGAVTVTATVADLGPVVFQITALPGPPAEIQMVSGDGQIGAINQALDQPLVVQVRDEFGNPADVTVAFATPDGGSFMPAQAPTDAQGEAQSVWTLGPATGVQTATATVSDLPPVSFSAEAFNPCALARVYEIGTTATGTLEDGDCQLSDGTFIDLYAFEATAQASLEFTLTSADFDAFLWLFDGTGSAVALDDDGAGGTNSAMRVIIRPDQYFVGANSFSEGETGDYSLSSDVAPTDVAGCATVWITRGVQTDQVITENDCVDTSGPFYSDQYLLVIFADQTVTITQTSTEVDAFLQLFNSDGNLVASDDDSAGGTDAQLVYTAVESDVFILDVATFNAEEVGAYTLTIEN